MPASETRIPVSRDVRRELRMVKAREEKHSYDDAIRHLLEDAGAGETLSVNA